MLLFALLLGGCATLQFYGQAVRGQWQLLHARTSIDALLSDAQTDPQTVFQLNLSQRIIGFAQSQLGLAADGRYSSFVALDRPYVVWNVFAAPEYSVEGLQWCYPFIGCAPYQGYFNEEMALRAAQRFARQGYETYVGGVPAYSTLGWFDDPLLSSFIHWPEADLANLLIHELAHSRVWVRGDVAFNESFAEFVGNEGLRAWFVAQNDMATLQQWRKKRAAWFLFRDFVMTAKAQLQAVYEETAQAALEVKQQRKSETLRALQACYEHHRELLGGGRYDPLMADGFNNAFLVSVGTYADYLPGFAGLFAEVGEDWPAFFTAVEELAELDAVTRQQRLTSLAEQDVRHTADHHNPQQVQCKTFSGHGAH